MLRIHIRNTKYSETNNNPSMVVDIKMTILYLHIAQKLKFCTTNCHKFFHNIPENRKECDFPLDRTSLLKWITIAKNEGKFGGAK